MAYILDISTEWTDEELKQLELIGASKIEGAIMVPGDTTGYLVSLQASLLKLMTPPLCFNCGQRMKRLESPSLCGIQCLTHVCPACFATERCERILPEG